MKKIKLLLVVIVLVTSYSLSAQMAVTTDGSSADASAMFEVKSTEKGMLIPRMTRSQIEAIENPANGLMVFNTTDNKFYTYIFAENIWKEILYGTGTITEWACGDALIDSRDSKSYTTVQIGTQCWMAENLNIGTRIAGVVGQTDNSTIEKYCYEDNETNCDTYGGLYQWDEMMQYVTTESVQGICPDGWHLPSCAEWATLTTFLDGESVAGGKMKEAGVTHWDTPNTGATNSSGFTGLPGGFSNAGGQFLYLGKYCLLWSSTEASETVAWSLGLTYETGAAGMSAGDYGATKAMGYSVRCVKD